ncbi:glycoside hydrolase family 25 protein [Enterococcus camelliae]|uniref:Glycoside hydrolase family 25 protein n=1 Tax=Enterococcus camelliae TaxID=453959 RepID=A0ABW5THQ2_9ENTE
MIIDISEWQVPATINYSMLAKQVQVVIVRVQYGKDYEDRAYKQHLQMFQSLGIPCAVYAWVRGKTIQEMKEEACIFYQRAQAFQPAFWWLDVEEQSMLDMRAGCERYRRTLKECGSSKVGAYIANHLYHQFQLDTPAFDAIWLPSYGKNTGLFEGVTPTATREYQLHQYTSNGRLSGYNGPLDLNQLNRTTFETLFGRTVSSKKETNENGKGELTLRTFQLEYPIYLRTKPTVQSGVIALLPKDAQVRIQNIHIADGYLWGEQLRSDGTKGYLALGNFEKFGKLIT